MKIIFAIFGLLVVLMWDLTQNNSQILQGTIRATLGFFRYLGF